MIGVGKDTGVRTLFEELWKYISCIPRMLYDLILKITDVDLKQGNHVFIPMNSDEWDDAQIIIALVFLSINILLLCTGFKIWKKGKNKKVTTYLWENVALFAGVLLPFGFHYCFDVYFLSVHTPLVFIIPAIGLSCVAVCIFVYIIRKSLENIGKLGACIYLFLTVINALIAQGTVLFWEISVVVLIVFGCYLCLAWPFIILSIIPKSEKSSVGYPSGYVPPQHRKDPPKPNVLISNRGEIHIRDNRGHVYDSHGNYVKTYENSDGDTYLGDKYTPRLYDHPDDKLW